MLQHTLKLPEWTRVAAAATFVSMIMISSGRAEDSVAAAKAAILGGKANQENFVFFKCQFTWTKANAATLEKALKGHYSDTRSCEFLWVKEGKREKFESLAHDVKRVKGHKGQETMEFIPFANLYDGERACRYFSPFDQAEVRDKENARDDKGDFTPFSMGFQAERKRHVPTYLLDWVESGRARLESRGVVPLREHAVVRFTFSSKQWGSVEYALNPNRGCLTEESIERLVSPAGKAYAESRTYLLDAKDCGDNRWFPMHLIIVQFPENPKAVFRVHDIRVTTLETVKKPTEEDLALVLPAGTVVKGPPGSGKEHFFRLKQQERITPNDLPRLATMVENAGKIPRMDTAIGPPRGYFKWYLLTMGTGLLVLSLAWFWRVRRRTA